MGTDRQSTHRKRRFLKAFEACGNVSGAARTAGVARDTVYGWLEHDEAFGAAYRSAEVGAKHAVETEIRRRGLDGWLEPVYQGGEQVGEIRKYSDTLLIFLAKRLMPEYREKISIDVDQVVRSYRNVDAARI